jgi:hypothetical protein
MKSLLLIARVRAPARRPRTPARPSRRLRCVSHAHADPPPIPPDSRPPTPATGNRTNERRHFDASAGAAARPSSPAFRFISFRALFIASHFRALPRRVRARPDARKRRKKPRARRWESKGERPRGIWMAAALPLSFLSGAR